MQKDLSERNKKMQSLLKAETFSDGIKELLSLRDLLAEEMRSWKNGLTEDDFSKMPYIGAKGYHSKTVAYSIWHIMRIEDVVVNTLIRGGEEVLFSGDYVKRIKPSVFTTGNELQKEEIREFSKRLDINALYDYADEVKGSTDVWLKSISYADLKRKFTVSDREKLVLKNVVCTDEKAFWLIDYWCKKDVKGLILMPLSRHWIMHVEAAERIIARIKRGK